MKGLGNSKRLKIEIRSKPIIYKKFIKSGI